jgi:hypothetical protein
MNQGLQYQNGLNELTKVVPVEFWAASVDFESGEDAMLSVQKP